MPRNYLRSLFHGFAPRALIGILLAVGVAPVAEAQTPTPVPGDTFARQYAFEDKNLIPTDLAMGLKAACASGVDEDACDLERTRQQEKRFSAKDYKKVYKWLERACERRSDGFACFVAAAWVEDFRSIRGDVEDQYELLVRGCEAGFGPACHEAAEDLGIIRQVDGYEAKGNVSDLLAAGCSLSHPFSCAKLGVIQFAEATDADSQLAAIATLKKCPRFRIENEHTVCTGIYESYSKAIKGGDFEAYKLLAEHFPQNTWFAFSFAPDTPAGDQMFEVALANLQKPDVTQDQIRGALWNVAGRQQPDRLARILELLDGPVEVETLAPLQQAASNNDLESLRLLLDAGADPDYLDIQGMTALIAAANRGHFEAVELLIRAGADPNIAVSKAFDEKQNGFVPIHASAGAGHLSSLRAMLRAGADPDPNPEGVSPLVLAIMSKKNQNLAETIELLAEAGADLGRTNSLVKVTPLVLALREGKPEAVQSLLENGADPNKSIANGDTPLIWAVKNDHLDLADRLLDYGANPDLTGSDGRTAEQILVARSAAEQRKRVAKRQAEERRRLAERRREQERKEDVGFAVGLLGAVAGAYVASEAGMDVDTGSQLAAGIGQAVGGAVSGNERQVAIGQHLMSDAQQQLVEKMESRRRLNDIARRQYLERAAADSPSGRSDHVTDCPDGPCLKMTNVPEPEPEAPAPAPDASAMPSPSRPDYQPPSGDDIICKATGMTRAEAEASEYPTACPH